MIAELLHKRMSSRFPWNNVSAVQVLIQSLQMAWRRSFVSHQQKYQSLRYGIPSYN